jgi:hypothetical protein
MRFARVVLIFAVASCGSSHSGTKEGTDGATNKNGDAATSGDGAIGTSGDGSVATGANTTTITIDGGPTGDSPNVPYISITVCPPGKTAGCVTLDHVILDTGSVGLRIPVETINATPGLLAALPNEQVGGSDISECYIYAAGYFYGSVRTADVSIGGEKAAALPIQIGGDLTTVPASCSNAAKSAGATTNISSATALHANAIIGVAGEPYDCGNNCIAAAGQPNPFYYACSEQLCTASGVPITQQVPQPVSKFAADNNGIIISLPTVDDTMGSPSLTGTLVFGIETQSNNALGSATVLEQTNNTSLPLVTANVTVGSSSDTFADTVFDSGTALYIGALTGLTACTGQFKSYYCPTSLQTLATTLTGQASTTAMTTVKVSNAEDFFTSAPATTAAFDDLAGNIASIQPGLFIVGLAHFYGQKIYIGINGATIGTHTGPILAF